MNYRKIKDKGIKLLGAVSIAFLSIIGTAPISLTCIPLKSRINNS
ncbi:MAG: hypothetical protein RR925_08945 [Erysipelotrichaceae bacterium]